MRCFGAHPEQVKGGRQRRARDGHASDRGGGGDDDGEVPTAVYIAAPPRNAPRAREVARALEAAGCSVVSRWLVGDGPVDYSVLARPEADEALDANLEDLDTSQVVVALTDGAERDGEVYCDLARAIDRHKLIVWSLERGGACLSTESSRAWIWPAKADADIPDAVQALVSGVRHFEGRRGG